MRLHDQIMGALKDAGRSAAQFAQVSVQGDAVEAGWPAKEAAKITAAFSDGYLQFDNLDADNWEYGDENRPPLAVQRQFLNHAEEHVDKVYARALDRRLSGLL